MKIIFLMMILLVFPIGCERSFQRENAFATEEKENASFKVRISGFRERRRFGGALAGAEYVFEAKNKDEPDWKEFMAFQYDDPIPIDRNSIVLVDEMLGYVFMVRKFAVTTTGGTTWVAWDESKLAPLRDDLSCRIQGVNVMKNGTGTMDIKCNKSVVVLSTGDAGLTWHQ